MCQKHCKICLKFFFLTIKLTKSQYVFAFSVQFSVQITSFVTILFLSTIHSRGFSPFKLFTSSIAVVAVITEIYNSHTSFISVHDPQLVVKNHLN